MMQLLYQPRLFMGRIRSKKPQYSALGLKIMCIYLFSLTLFFICIFESCLPIVTGLVTYLSLVSIKQILKIKALYSCKMEKNSFSKQNPLQWGFISSWLQKAIKLNPLLCSHLYSPPL